MMKSQKRKKESVDGDNSQSESHDNTKDFNLDINQTNHTDTMRIRHPTDTKNA